MHLPTDFGYFNFTPAEDDLWQLGVLDDRRSDEQLGEPPTIIIDEPLNNQQLVIDERWNTNRPIIHESLWPFLKNSILNDSMSGRNDFSDSFVRGMYTLISYGNSVDSQYATSGRELRSARGRRGAGLSNHPAVIWGEKVARIDYSSLELSIGPIHFAAIDMGVN